LLFGQSDQSLAGFRSAARPVCMRARPWGQDFVHDFGRCCGSPNHFVMFAGIAFAGRGERMSEKQPRSRRQPVAQDGMIYGDDGARIAPCRLRNISTTGAQIELHREADLPKTFRLALSENGRVQRRCTIVWQFSTVVGVKFADRKQP
jgi:hypothetical protein